MRRFALPVLAAALLFAGSAQAMSVSEFLATANAIPRNPTALMRPDTRRLMGEIRSAMSTLRSEQAAARAAGRTPATCMPDEVRLSPNDILGRLNAVPQARRSISVTQAMREWMAERHPCRG